MTVGAVVVPARIEEALADASGRIAVRRIVDFGLGGWCPTHHRGQRG